MKTMLKVTLLLMLSLTISGPVVAQNSQSVGTPSNPDAELHQRILNQAISEYNRARDFARSAGNLTTPERRTSYYQQMLTAVGDARRLLEGVETSGRVNQQINELVNSYWALEHNAAVNILTNGDGRTLSQSDHTARVHLENAILIQPDSMASYQTLAWHLLDTGDTTEALALFEDAIDRFDTPAPELYDDLIELYFQEARYEEITELAARALRDYPEEEAFLQYQIDAHLQLGERKETIPLLRNLIEKESGNPLYHLLLGSQLYQLAVEQPDAQVLLIREPDPGAPDNNLVQEAINELETAAELDPSNAQIFGTLGIIYRNRAIVLFGLHDSSDDILEALNYDRRGREQLEQARAYTERAADLNPEESEYLESLYHIYTRLGLATERDEVIRKLQALE